MRMNFTLTIDDQDVRELFNGRCPYCNKIASYGVRRPKGNLLTKEKLDKIINLFRNDFSLDTK